MEEEHFRQKGIVTAKLLTWSVFGIVKKLTARRPSAAERETE